MERVCFFVGCGRPMYAKGWCSRHWRRLLRYGNPAAGWNPEALTDSQRFWAKVNKNGPLWDGTHCWEWRVKNSQGYGRFAYKGRQIQAHRFAYEEANGPIPEGLFIDHLCRVRHCVNPAHLEVVTLQENNHRGMAGAITRARMLARTMCRNGHPYSPQNTVMYRGERMCVACRKARQVRARKL